MAVGRSSIVSLLLLILFLCEASVGSDSLNISSAQIAASHFPLTPDNSNNYDDHETYKTCLVGELFCSDDCDLLMLCLANHDSITVRNCSETDKMCDSITSQCLDRVNAVCDPLPEAQNFTCRATGLLPNPYDCHSYYTCPSTGSQGTKQTCSNNDPSEYGYDPLFNTCTYTTKDRVCVENPIPDCVVPTQSGGQVENPNIYYICVHDLDLEGAPLVPWLFRCNKANEVFDDVIKECVVRVTSTTTMTSVMTTKAPGGVGKMQPMRVWWILLLAASEFLNY